MGFSSVPNLVTSGDATPVTCFSCNDRRFHRYRRIRSAFVPNHLSLLDERSLVLISRQKKVQRTERCCNMTALLSGSITLPEPRRTDRTVTTASVHIGVNIHCLLHQIDLVVSHRLITPHQR
jgi:hypothetical protein